MSKFPHAASSSSPRTPIPLPSPPQPAQTQQIPTPQSPPPVAAELQMVSAWRIGRYTKAERKLRIERYRQKRARRDYSARVLYECRKKIADRRLRVHGRFVKHETGTSSNSTPTSTPTPTSRASGSANANANVGEDGDNSSVTRNHAPKSVQNSSNTVGSAAFNVDLSEEFLNIPDDTSTTRR